MQHLKLNSLFLLFILLAYLFASGDRHLLQFAMAELGVCANRQTCRLTEEENSGLRNNETKLQKRQYAPPCSDLKDL